MDKYLLELWGQTLQEMAKIARGPENFFDFFQNGFLRREQEPDGVYDQVVQLWRRMYGREGIERFNEVMKEFYDQVGVVPRTQYNELHEKYVALKSEVLELEHNIEKLKKKLENGPQTPLDLMEQWQETARKYAEINRQFFEEFSKFFKP